MIFKWVNIWDAHLNFSESKLFPNLSSNSTKKGIWYIVYYSMKISSLFFGKNGRNMS